MCEDQYSACCVFKGWLLSRFQFSELAKSFLNSTIESWGSQEKRGKATPKTETGALQMKFALGRGELTSLSHEGEVVSPRVEGSVETQLEQKRLAPAHYEPLQAHLLRVMPLVVSGALQVDGPELQCRHWERSGDTSLPSCSSLGSAAPDTSQSSLCTWL